MFPFLFSLLAACNSLYVYSLLGSVNVDLNINGVPFYSIEEEVVESLYGVSKENLGLRLSNIIVRIENVSGVDCPKSVDDLEVKVKPSVVSDLSISSFLNNEFDNVIEMYGDGGFDRGDGAQSYISESCTGFLGKSDGERQQNRKKLIEKINAAVGPAYVNNPDAVYITDSVGNQYLATEASLDCDLAQSDFTTKTVDFRLGEDFVWNAEDCSFKLDFN